MRAKSKTVRFIRASHDLQSKTIRLRSDNREHKIVSERTEAAIQLEKSIKSLRSTAPVSFVQIREIRRL